MKKFILFIAIGFIAALQNSCQNEELLNPEESIEIIDKQNSYSKEYFLVANRGSGTISVFDAKTTRFIRNIKLPDSNAEPTYLAHSKTHNRLYVGDFANKKILYFNAKNFRLKGEIKIKKGALHMALNKQANQLWVNNIISKKTTIIDLNSNSVIKNIKLPFDKIKRLTTNAVQHDITINPVGKKAYISILDGLNKSYIVAYDTKTFKYIDHKVVGGGARLLSVKSKLYVSSKEDNKLSVFRNQNLNLISNIPFKSAHGIASSDDYIFTTGIKNNKLAVIDRKNNRIISRKNTAYGRPHNLAVNSNGNRLFVSHSDPNATQVVFYKVKRNGTLQKISQYDSGLNPYGVLYY
ncbi:hypothetical protein ABW636_14735 [Aquimarina sp. 2201CG1-2-11]|uniref:YncE family protein n=1 Tax=Aquimarina discodermiae TaxID=3231043 RepID=UPI003461A2E9